MIILLIGIVFLGAFAYSESLEKEVSLSIEQGASSERSYAVEEVVYEDQVVPQHVRACNG